MDRIAVVVGGGGVIGLAIAARLADRYTVCLADIDEQRLGDGLRALASPHFMFAGDLTDEDTVSALTEALSHKGTVSALVNCAGISPKLPEGKKEISEISAEEFRRVMDVNTLMPFLLVKHLAPIMPTDGSASIVNILSITARLASGGVRSAQFPPHISAAAHYGASKAALHNLQISMSRELAFRRIRVNGVSPGLVETSLNEMLQDDVRKKMISQVPLGRSGTPLDIARAVDFLIGPDSTYVTGAVLDVNGGWLPA